MYWKIPNFAVGLVPPGMVCVDLLASAHLRKVIESSSEVGTCKTDSVRPHDRDITGVIIITENYSLI
jgi:hypothetical protein